jgi:plastocyanin
VRRLRCLLVVLAAIGCDNQGSSGPTQASVTVNDNEFVPSTVHPGANGTVTWIWNGQMSHDVIFVNGMGRSGLMTIGIYQWDFTGAAAGDYLYYCSLHAGMTGRVVVP